MNHRFVCRTFKTAVEDVFRDKYLRKTYIRWDLGLYRPPNGMKTFLALEYGFDSLIENGDKAVFETDPGDEECRDEVKMRQREAMEDHSVFLPRHTVQINRELFDTPIPGLEVNSKDWTITFDWKAMFTRFYGEERHYHRSVAEFAGRQKEYADELKAKMQRGEMDMMQVMSKAFTMIADWSHGLYKVARRTRISRTIKEQGEEWYWDTLDEDMIEEEKRALEDLAKRRQFASMEDSDDEGDDETSDEDIKDDEDDEDDEDADEEESEEDEWEDEEILHD
ncbi:hypothetical protein HYALB_00009713 [Hymenoscyphus albidus]|uniref:Uncharacterized protein n=1 Tax=Hymenoscyphus albidus TaxID=595503 RepID=A0A9N9PXW6_9HELO|nr:hypothetical protein HYALB_00009713 [Hymenoscyphus albidus]